MEDGVCFQKETLSFIQMYQMEITLTLFLEKIIDCPVLWVRFLSRAVCFCSAFNIPIDIIDEFVSSHALAYNIGKILGKSGTIAVLSLLADLFLGGGAAAAGGATLALGGAMVVVSSSVIAIEWSALTAGSLSLSVSDHSSGSGEVEEGESETGESLWKPTENKNNLWNKGKLKKHYDKHGGDFGAKSAQEYSDMAVEFGTRNSDDIVQTIHEGYVYRYEPSTNTVFVGTAKGGKVKSFYVWDGRENDLVINTLRDFDLIP